MAGGKVTIKMWRIMYKTVGVVFMGLLPAHAMTITGIVKDSATGTPVTTAVVSLRAWGSTSARVKTATDTSGAYRLTWDTTGVVDLRARDTTGAYLTADDSVPITGIDTITVDLFLVKIPIVTVSGTVTSDQASGTPVANAVVTLSAPGGATFKDTAGADGNFRVDVPATGKYTVTVSAAGFVTLGDSVMVNAASAVAKNLQLSPIVYCSVGGTVGNTSSGSAPIAGAMVTVMKNSGVTRIVLRDTTGSDGTYAFDSLATGKYYLSVSAAGFTATSDSVVLSDAAPVAKNVTLSPVVLGSLSGAVTDGSNGDAPVAQAVVTLIQFSGMIFLTKSDTTGAEGKYGFDSLPAGRYTITVSVSGAGFAAAIDSAVISDTTHVGKDITLHKSSGIHGNPTRPKSVSTAPSVVLTKAKTLRIANLTGPATLQLIDLTGRTFRSWTLSSSLGPKEFSLKTTAASGWYAACIVKKNEIVRSRIVIP
jgi:hypothetical protein